MPADARGMQGTLAQVRGNLLESASTSATSLHPAPRTIAADFTLGQRLARVGLTAVVIVAMSVLFASQIAATLH